MSSATTSCNDPEAPGRIHAITLHGNGNRPMLQVKVNGNLTEALVDTGSDVTVLNTQLAEQCFLRKRSAKFKLKLAANKHELTAQEATGVEFEVGSSRLQWDVYVADITPSAIIGNDMIHELRLILDLENKKAHINHEVLDLRPVRKGKPPTPLICSNLKVFYDTTKECEEIHSEHRQEDANHNYYDQGVRS